VRGRTPKERGGARSWGEDSFLPQNSGANGKFLPSHEYFPAEKFRYPASRRRAPALRSSRYSLLTLLFHLRQPNLKTNEPKFWQILSLENSFAKTSSALFSHLPEYLYGQNPKKKNVLSFLEKTTPAKSGQTEWAALCAAHSAVPSKPLSSILVSLLYQARTYFQNK